MTFGKEYENCFFSILWFVKTIKGGKSGPGNYYYFSFPNNRSIRVDAQYSATCGKQIWQEVKITGWPGSKYDMQNERWNSWWKNFYTRKPRKKNKFLVYLPILKLRWNFRSLWGTVYPYFFLDIFIKVGEKGPLVERSGCWIEFYIQLESLTT